MKEVENGLELKAYTS